jgi:hypothetical protein
VIARTVAVGGDAGVREDLVGGGGEAGGAPTLVAGAPLPRPARVARLVGLVSGVGVGSALTTLEVRSGRGVGSSSSEDSKHIGSAAEPRVVVVCSIVRGGVTRFFRGERRVDRGVDTGEPGHGLESRDDDPRDDGILERAERPRLLGDTGGDGRESTTGMGEEGGRLRGEDGAGLSSLDARDLLRTGDEGAGVGCEALPVAAARRRRGAGWLAVTCSTSRTDGCVAGGLAKKSANASAFSPDFAGAFLRPFPVAPAAAFFFGAAFFAALAASSSSYLVMRCGHAARTR